MVKKARLIEVDRRNRFVCVAYVENVNKYDLFNHGGL
jgi:hypothetical protein